jgi:hypothetical protein
MSPAAYNDLIDHECSAKREQMFSLYCSAQARSHYSAQRFEACLMWQRDAAHAARLASVTLNLAHGLGEVSP